IKTAILCSSDSDLQPAVQEVRRRGVEVVYLGFEFQPNKGLMYTTNNTVLFRNSEIIKACEIA
ncbi:NYN domain-containing protein, partial [Patescibacteria group bacterium]|nr:NYN domain-containing protein [Patescibacteria group bacterium]